MCEDSFGESKGKETHEETHAHRCGSCVRDGSRRRVRTCRLLVGGSSLPASAVPRALPPAAPAHLPQQAPRCFRRGCRAADLRSQLADQGHGRGSGALHQAEPERHVRRHAVQELRRAELHARGRRVCRHRDHRFQGHDGHGRGKGLHRQGNPHHDVQERPGHGHLCWQQ